MLGSRPEAAAALQANDRMVYVEVQGGSAWATKYMYVDGFVAVSTTRRDLKLFGAVWCSIDSE